VPNVSVLGIPSKSTEEEIRQLGGNVSDEGVEGALGKEVNEEQRRCRAANPYPDLDQPRNNGKHVGI